MELADLLAERRRDLTEYFSAMPRAGSVIDFQVAMMKEFQRQPTNKSEKVLLKQHRKLLRALGDALAWQLFDSHLIRTLRRHPGKPGSPPSEEEDLRFIVQVMKILYGARKIPVLTDLTNVLLVGDIVAFGVDGIEVVECKRSPLPAAMPASGRLARQRVRGEAAAEYMRESAIKEPDGITRLAVDVDLPDPDVPALQDVLSAALGSEIGLGWRALGEGDFLIAITHAAIETGSFDVMLAEETPKMAKPLLSQHADEFDDPSPTARSILSYPLEPRVRAALLEGDLMLIRLIDLALFEEPSPDGIALHYLGDSAFAGQMGDTHAHLYPRFLDDVMTGPISVSSMRGVMFEEVRRVHALNERITPDDESTTVGPADETRGSGSAVHYVTAYQAGEEIALVMLAAEIGLGEALGDQFAVWYPMSQRLGVLGSEREPLDLSEYYANHRHE